MIPANELQPNELRVGNLILKNDNVADEPETISVSVHDFYWIEKYPDSYEGIPLTEEWLLRFGFEYTKNSFYDDYKLDKLWLQYSDENTHHAFVGDFITPIQYVHQLQNLYFALTNTELTLKHELENN